jgi:hypothetical protein
MACRRRSRISSGLREALRQRKATPAALARAASEGGVAKIVGPYLEALTSDA